MPRERGGPAARARKEGKEAASPPLIGGARRAGYGAAPPASRVFRIALARDSPAGCPGPRRPRRPLEAGKRSGPGPAPARRAARRPAVAGGCRDPDAREQVNWCSIVRRGGEITQIQGWAPGPVTSSQQSHLAKLRHTKPGVHETRDAPK